jgi:hypothetical protein
MESLSRQSLFRTEVRIDDIDRMMTNRRKTIFFISGWESAAYFANK